MMKEFRCRRSIVFNAAQLSVVAVKFMHFTAGAQCTSR